MRPAIEVVTPPADAPISVAAFKAGQRISTTTEDAYISGLIAAATEVLEEQYGLAFVTRTVKAYWPYFLRGPWVLPGGKVAEIGHVKYTPAVGSRQIVDPSIYQLLKRNPPELRLAYAQSWPSVTLAPGDAVEVQYLVGFGLADEVPMKIKLAVQLLAATWYEHRENFVVGQAAAVQLPNGVHFLMQGEKHFL